MDFPEVEGGFYGTKLVENFYVRWTGLLRVDKEGEYEFSTSSDDGSRLSINGKVVVDNGGVHPMATQKGKITLPAGDHQLVIDYTQGGGGAGITVNWQPPKSKKMVTLPDSVLYHAKGSEKIVFDKAAWDKIPSASGKPVIDYGPTLTHCIESSFPAPRTYAYKGIVIKLSEDATNNLCFDTDTLRVMCAWNDGYMKLPKGRDGLEGHPVVQGNPIFGSLAGPGWAKGDNFSDPRTNKMGPLPEGLARWTGHYMDGNDVILSYTVGKTTVLEKPSVHDRIIARSFNMSARTEALSLLVAEEPGATATVVGDVAVIAANGVATVIKLIGAPAGAELVASGNRVHLAFAANKESTSFVLAHARGDAEATRAALTSSKITPVDLSAQTKGGKPRWGQPLATTFTMGNGESAYVVDTVEVPNDNKWKSYMRTSGFDFFPDGRAAVATIDGDVWMVSNMTGDGTPKWQRFATGMFQPLGVKVVDGLVHVLCRDQLTVLHDLNKDGEADFYANLNNHCLVTDNYHEFALDLQTDKAGNFYYSKGSPWPPDVKSAHQGCLMKVAKDGSTLEVFATGLRAPNGMGMGPNDELTFSDNQGHWMPACKVNWVKPGGFYGMVPAAHRSEAPKDFDRPLFWLPMNMDNSSGGEGWVKGNKWGPFDGQLLHTSYGKGTFFICFHEEVAGKMQGGAVKLPLNFVSGVMRIRQSPTDGQIWLVGMRGWQTAGSQAGALQRVRWTGAPANLPKKIQTKKDALVITFSAPLAKDAGSADNLSIEAWNYKWTGNYGSPEVKPSDGKEGHDTIVPSKVSLSADGKSLTLEWLGLKPIDQIKIKYKLEAANGEVLSNEIYYTINAVP